MLVAANPDTHFALAAVLANKEVIFTFFVVR
jgi:hypothetical protein